MRCANRIMEASTTRKFKPISWLCSYSHLLQQMSIYTLASNFFTAAAERLCYLSSSLAVCSGVLRHITYKRVYFSQNTFLSHSHRYCQRSFYLTMTKRHDQIAFPWLSLPADIRLLVLDEISGQKHHGWAQCAAVCREWQAILEPKNFSQLALEPSCLDNLETLVIRQRPLVQHICLNIDLPGYTCRSCKRSDTMSSRRPTIFRRAILRLFSILSTWQPTGRLTLELSASSPSDSQHWFKNYCFGSGHEDTRDWTQQEKAIKWHDPKHGWVDGQQVKTPDLPAFMRLFSPLCLNVPQNLPVVHAVTSFCIRRQLRHELFPQVLKALWDKLPRLESIVYELWRARRHYCQIACAYGTFDPMSYPYVGESLLPEPISNTCSISL
jgi:hypothetical protein